MLANRCELSALVEGDAFFGFLAQGAVPPWLPGSNEQNDVVIQAAAAAAGRYASGGYMTVYDGVVGPLVSSDVRLSDRSRSAEVCRPATGGRAMRRTR